MVVRSFPNNDRDYGCVTNLNANRLLTLLDSNLVKENFTTKCWFTQMFLRKQLYFSILYFCDMLGSVPGALFLMAWVAEEWWSAKLGAPAPGRELSSCVRHGAQGRWARQFCLKRHYDGNLQPHVLYRACKVRHTGLWGFPLLDFSTAPCNRSYAKPQGARVESASCGVSLGFPRKNEARRGAALIS